jgi:AraC-like DNA-binding protein/quercetin dioxygenase-like cupin family protein
MPRSLPKKEVTRDNKQAGPLLKSAHLFTSPPPIPHLPLVAAGVHYAKQGQHYPAHYHLGLEIVIYRTGQIELHHDFPGKPIIETQPGLVIITPTGVAHYERALTDYSLVYLNFKQGELEHFIRGHTFDEVLTFFDADHRLEQVVSNLATEWGRTLPHSDHMIELLFNEFVILFQRLAAEPESPAERLVQKVEAVLEQHFSSRPSIPAIAEELGVSSSLVRLYFAKLRNYSPKTYLQTVRLNRALELIKGSSLTLETIAEITGYDSASHLNHHVKKQTGKAPGAFRSKP